MNQTAKKIHNYAHVRLEQVVGYMTMCWTGTGTSCSKPSSRAANTVRTQKTDKKQWKQLAWLCRKVGKIHKPALIIEIDSGQLVPAALSLYC